MTIVAVGPLTNVASALRRAPRIGDGIERIAIMGGAIGLGNTTPSAEFNIHVDPEAADEVFRAGIPITLVPLEVTHRALATDAVLARIAALDTTVARMSVALMRFFAETYLRVFDFDAPAVHDPCAVAAVIDPAIVPTRRMNVAIDTASSLSLGRTVCDVYGKTGRAPNASRNGPRRRGLLGPDAGCARDLRPHLKAQADRDGCSGSACLGGGSRISSCGSPSTDRSRRTGARSYSTVRNATSIFPSPIEMSA